MIDLLVREKVEIKGKIRDLTGLRFGRLTVLGIAGRYYYSSTTMLAWECLCECGNTTIVTGSALSKSNLVSCGCYRNEKLIQNSITHGSRNNYSYDCYSGMLSRCNNIDNPNYPNYGGRGIKVCDRWLEPEGQGFLNFLEDMGERPEGLTLDRKDVNANYEPSNCRWVDRSIQSFNRNLFKNNTSGVTGVSWREDLQKYVALINKDGERHYLGSYENMQDAIEARRKAELKFYAGFIE